MGTGGAPLRSLQMRARMIEEQWRYTPPIKMHESKNKGVVGRAFCK